MPRGIDLTEVEKTTPPSEKTPHPPVALPGSIQTFVRQTRFCLSQAKGTESLCGHQRNVVGILSPVKVEEVQLIMAAARAAGPSVQIQPIACGKNWGFGSHLPTRDNVFLLDLSQLNRIRSKDLVGHSVELEPGVTQGQLDDWLGQHGRSHYFNVTGAGTITSVIGNALEKGIGYSGSRHQDLLELEVVIPGGQLIRTSKHAELSKFGFGFSLGPGVTELFCQSNFGVVTAARIALPRRPPVMGAVICKVRNPTFFGSLVKSISDLIAEGACYGVPHIFNRERIVMSFAPHLDSPGAETLASSTASWTALVPIKGSQAVFDALVATVTERIGGYGEIEIVSDRTSGSQLNCLLQGRPSDFSHASVAYAVFGSKISLTAPIEQTGAGLIHVTPLVPLNGNWPEKAVDLAVQFLRSHGYANPQLSLNAVSSRVAALVIPIGFDRRSASDTAKAQGAAASLVRTFAQAGMLPYRLGLDQADCLPAMDETWSEIFYQMQTIFDPTRCMASSRYEPLWSAATDHTNKPMEDTHDTFLK